MSAPSDTTVTPSPSGNVSFSSPSVATASRALFDQQASGPSGKGKKQPSQKGEDIKEACQENCRSPFKHWLQEKVLTDDQVDDVYTDIAAKTRG